jgi:hypothetical protein
MPFIEIITDAKSQSQLSKAISKRTVKNADILYVKEKNLENIKNIKLETLVINRKIENTELIERILKNTKHVIVNIDFNEELGKVNKNTITFGYSSKADITISSVKEEEVMICIQNTINSIYGEKIGEQEVKVNINKRY